MYLLFYGHVVQELDQRCDKVLNIAAFCCKVAAYDISVVRHMNISAELQIRRFILHTVLCEVPLTYGHFLESMMYNNFVGICLLLLSKLQMLSAAYCNCIRVMSVSSHMLLHIARSHHAEAPVSLDSVLQVRMRAH